MRIVGGSLKGRGLSAPPGRSTRPTSDRVREAVFNVLMHGVENFDIKDARVLDLFAGSGALGLEALSRGAKFALFVEEDAAARGVIRENADSLGVLGQTKIWRRDATRLGPCASSPPFNLVFADPPYGKGLGEAALKSLIDGGWTAPDAVLVVEEAASVAIAALEELELIDQRIYGDAQVRFYRAG